MGIKQIPISVFIAFLESLGLEYERTRASHNFYNYPKGNPKRLNRPVVIRTLYKEIPLLHIHTNLKTLGISKKDFEEYLKRNS
jgi:predicted RNA binding protein YcfA (HicA-like mRNA interferase family)